MSAWARWYERHWRDWRPAAYRPGATLALVRRNLAACDGEAQDGRLLLRTKELSLEVRERVQAHLFMHIVSTEFSLFVAAPGGRRPAWSCVTPVACGVAASFARYAAGAGSSRCGRPCRGRPGLAGAAHAAGLPEFAPLPRRQGLDREPGTPGACEVVNRFPPIAATSLWSPSSAWPCWAPSPNCSACFLPPERPLPALPDAYPPVHLR